MDNPREGLKAALGSVADAIRTIEGRASAALDRGDQQAYRELMREKAQVLRGLPSAMAPFLERMDQPERQAVRERMERFAQGAATALELDSPFYMSALLYPEDHRQGEPNDLEAYAAHLESEGGRA